MDILNPDDESTFVDSYMSAIHYWSHLQATNQDVRKFFPDMPKSQLELLEKEPSDPNCIKYILEYSQQGKIPEKAEKEEER